MKNQKNNKILYGIIVILCCLVLVLVGYIVYDKVLEKGTVINENNNEIIQDNDSKQDNNVTNPDNSNNNTNYDNYNNWMDYIMSTDINSIKLEYCVEDSSNEDEIPLKKTLDISKKDLNRIFVEINKGKLVKNYYGGLGGPCMPSIDITYNTNKKQYNLDLFLYSFIDINDIKDQNILNHIQNSNYTIKKYSDDIDLETEAYMFEYVYNEDIINTIISENTK